MISQRQKSCFVYSTQVFAFYSASFGNSLCTLWEFSACPTMISAITMSLSFQIGSVLFPLICALFAARKFRRHIQNQQTNNPANTKSVTCNCVHILFNCHIIESYLFHKAYNLIVRHIMSNPMCEILPTAHMHTYIHRHILHMVCVSVCILRHVVENSSVNFTSRFHLQSTLSVVVERHIRCWFCDNTQKKKSCYLWKTEATTKLQHQKVLPRIFSLKLCFVVCWGLWVLYRLQTGERIRRLLEFRSECTKKWYCDRALLGFHLF